MLPEALTVLNLLLGVAILAFGRRLFWVGVGIFGFLAGAELAGVLITDHGAWLVIVAAVIAGAAGAVVAMLLPRLVFGLIGLLGGGYLGISAAQAMQWGDHLLLAALIGAALGAIIAVKVTDWALIVVSSLAGAAAVVGEFGLQPLLASATFIILTLVGAILQGRQLRREQF